MMFAYYSSLVDYSTLNVVLPVLLATRLAGEPYELRTVGHSLQLANAGAQHDSDVSLKFAASTGHQDPIDSEYILVMY